MEAHTSYIICTNPRSGSWLLSEGLQRTGIAGNPREWFDDATEIEECQNCSLTKPSTGTYAPYLDHVKRAGSSPNGIFGIKLHYYQFQALPAKLRTVPAFRNRPRALLLSAVLPNVKYIWLTRNDRVRQAISYCRACQTQGWWKIDDRERLPPQTTVSEVTFDPQRIEELENLLVSNDAGWRRYFEEVGARPLTIAYEELAADYEGTIRRVLEWLGIGGPMVEGVVIPPPRLAKQSDATTEEWIALYRQFKRGELTAKAGGIPDDWKAWIGENKLFRSPDSDIVEILVKNGFRREDAESEVKRADGDPYLRAGQWVVQRLKKAESHMAAYRALARLHPQAGTVERRSNVSRAAFLERYYSPNRPVILQGLMTRWSAMTEWSPEYLKEVLGTEEVEIMAARDADANYEINSHQHRRTILFGQYVDMVHGGGETNDFYLVANNGFLQRPKARQLLNDIEMFPEYLEAANADGKVFFWYGPAGTVTPLHHDTSNIFMAQVRGRKRVKLISPNDLEFVYNDVGVYSKVDCEHADLARWPQFRNATIIDVVLAPGEVLFLPVGWWHHARALDVSITISFTNFVFANHYEWNMPQIQK